MSGLVHETQNELPEAMREQVVQLLNQRLADAIDLAAQAKHVNALAGALAEFGARIRRAIDETDELGDRDTADICTEISRGIDKWLWFVEAHVAVPAGAPAGR